MEKLFGMEEGTSMLGFKHIIPITKPLLKSPKNSKVDIELFLREFQFELLYATSDRYFIVSYSSGIFFELDSVAYNLLTKRETTVESECSNEVKEELKNLFLVGAFDSIYCSETDNEINIKTVNINISSKCNLSCIYCFAEEGTYEDSYKDMSLNTLKKILDNLTQERHDSTPVNVVLFGGEPLLRMDLVEYTIQYSKAIRETSKTNLIVDIFTNGTLIDENLINLIKDDSCIRLLVSIDGTPETTDCNRRAKNGKKVSEIIKGKMPLILKIPENRVVARCTLTEVRPNIIEKTEYLNKLGFKNIVYDVAYCDPCVPIATSFELLHELESELHGLANYLIKKIRQKEGMNINLLSETIAQILMNNKKAQSPFVPKCPGGRTYVSIDTEGKIYPCHFLVGNVRFQIGDISIDGLKGKDMIIDNGIVDLSQNKFGNCITCMLKNICEGPCLYKQLVLYRNYETVPKAHCSIYKARLKESLRILSVLYNKEKWPYYNDWLKIINERGVDKICL